MMFEKLSKLIVSMAGESPLTAWMDQQAEEQRRRELLQRISQEAMQRVDLDMTQTPFVIRDIGILAYRSEQNAKIVRNQAIITDTRYLRPFAEIQSKSRRSGLVRFEIYDSQNNMLFADEESQRLGGTTRVVSKSWLPLANLKAPIGRWTVVVFVNGLAIGAHPLKWEVLADNDILNQLRTDGEINDDLRNQVQSGKFRRMSLDELLADQEE